MSARERSTAQRERMAYETARIMIEQGLSDINRARRKAATRTGIADRRHWPSNEDVRAAVLTQRRLFRGETHRQALHQLREAACEAMRVFAAFRPRLIGAVLEGSADEGTAVELLLFAEQPEAVLFTLLDWDIPWRESERTLRHCGGQRQVYPSFCFMAGEVAFELIVLPVKAQRQPPLDPVTERPSLGADLAGVEQHLAEEDSADAQRLENGR